MPEDEQETMEWGEDKEYVVTNPPYGVAAYGPGTTSYTRDDIDQMHKAIDEAMERKEEDGNTETSR